MNLRKFALIVTATLALVFAGLGASAVTPTFVTSQDGNTFTFDATNSFCQFGPCSYNWRYYGPGTNRLGATLGFGQVVTKTFTTPGTYYVVLKQGDHCFAGSTSYCAGTTYTVVSVQ